MITLNEIENENLLYLTIYKSKKKTYFSIEKGSEKLIEINEVDEIPFLFGIDYSQWTLTIATEDKDYVFKNAWLDITYSLGKSWNFILELTLNKEYEEDKENVKVLLDLIDYLKTKVGAN